MTKIVSATYASLDAAKMAYDDLIDTGYSTDNLLYDPKKPHIAVRSSADTEREVLEILNRHGPTEVSDRTE